jgi:hypothetical protein
MRITQFALAVAFAGLGIWGLARADYGFGAMYLAFSAAWVLIAVFSDRLAAIRERSRGGPPS